MSDSGAHCYEPSPVDHVKSVQNLYAFFTSRRAASRVVLARYGMTTLIVALTLGAAFVFRRLPHANLSLLFLTVVLLIAARFGLWPSIYASVLSFFALNFFFTQPYYTFAVEEEGDFATLLFFLGMAALTGNLAARMRSESAKNRAALARVSALLDFSRQMAAASSADAALEALAERLAKVSGVRALALRADAGEKPDLTGWTLLPLKSAGGNVGLAAIDSPEFDAAQRSLIEGLCDQAAIAAERARLVDSLRQAEIIGETERLRAALLSSVSHDLRTPLVSIIGSTSSLLEYRSILKPEDREELLRTVLAEAERLNRYIQNLLDMTRFGGKPLTIDREWIDLNDLVSSAIERLGPVLERVAIDVEVAPDAAFLRVQGALIEQVIVNLLDNAASFAPDGGRVGIRAYRREGSVIIEVENEGPVIPETERERIFDMFHRAAQGDRNRQGTGLGLAICRSIAAAHDGTIEAGTRADGTGALLTLTLPADRAPDRELTS